MAVVELLESRSLFASLSAGDVSAILAAAGSQAQNKQAVVVSDREGVILGVFAVGKATSLTLTKAAVRARTAAFFQSAENAFTTRTARFIIQDNFPFPVPNTEGGPLYGVQFSSLPGSDVFSGPAISGDPGGIPLYKNGEPVGGIGVAGDGHDVAARADALEQPNASVDNAKLESFTGQEESDFDESVALAGAASYAAPDAIHADRTLINGLRFPFTKDKAATGQSSRSLTQLFAAGVGALKKLAGFKTSSAIRASVAAPYPAATFGGVFGELKNTNPAAKRFGFVSGNDFDASGINLTVADVKRVITRAVQQATITRAGIRLPIGTSAKVHVAVVDRDGDLLGVFRHGRRHELFLRRRRSESADGRVLLRQLSRLHRPCDRLHESALLPTRNRRLAHRPTLRTAKRTLRPLALQRRREEPAQERHHDLSRWSAAL